MASKQTQQNNRRNGHKQSAYLQLAQTLEDLKQEKISVRTAMHKLQFRGRPERPYAKVTKMGAVALFGITRKPIVLYESQWHRLMKTVESGYLHKYMEYNAGRISHGKEHPVDPVADPTPASSTSDNNGVAEVLASSVATEEVAADASA